MLGSTDVQVARLFQRRLALDALVGGIAGAAVGAGRRTAGRRAAGGLGSELVGGVAAGASATGRCWRCCRSASSLLATLAARWTVTRRAEADAVSRRGDRARARVVVLAWCLGFAAFMLLLPGPLEGNTTDAIVVPTGGAGADRPRLRS